MSKTFILIDIFKKTKKKYNHQRIYKITIFNEKIK